MFASTTFLLAAFAMLAPPEAAAVDVSPTQAPVAVQAISPAIAVPTAVEPQSPVSVATPPPSAEGPIIELAPDDQASAEPPQPIPATSKPIATNSGNTISWGLVPNDEDPLLYGLTPERRRASSTVIGGYGQFNLTAARTGPADKNEFFTRANLRRLVLFVAQDLSDSVEIYTELEWENAIACQTCQGAVEVEQAIVDWKLLKDKLVLRTGLVLVPMGIVNQWHEPPIFNGVDRPEFDQVIIPSTWRELGIGVTGQFSKIFRYELYAMTPINPGQIGPQGFMGGRTFGSLARVQSPAFSGRLEAEPVLGVVVGASGYYVDLGKNETFYHLGKRKRPYIPLAGYSIDARTKKKGIEARLVWAQFFSPRAGTLQVMEKIDGSKWFPNLDATGPLPERTQGGYAELGYNVLYPLKKTQHELVGFVRAETYDTQAKVPKGFSRVREFSVQELTMGLSYRPLRTLVFKFDVQLRDRQWGNDTLLINGGIGFMM